MSNADTLGYVLTEFDTLTKHPEKYLSAQDNITVVIKEIAKNLYDFTKQHECNVKNSSALPHLIIEDFDEEQIWQEIELQNNSVWSHFLKNVSFCVAGKHKLRFPVEVQEPDVPAQTSIGHPTDDAMEIDEPVSENVRKLIKKKKRKKKVLKTSAVDDKFFKLDDMESFLNSEDKKVMKPSKNKNSNDSNSEDEDSIDLFEETDLENDLDDLEDDIEQQPKYKDFFDDPDNEISSEIDDEEKSKNNDFIDDIERDSVNDEDNSEPDISDLVLDDVAKKKKVKFNLDDNSSSDDGESNDNNIVQEKDNTQISTFELRKERLKKKIGHLENNMLSEKPWQMKGEVDASGRPQNSLLEEILDFDLTSRPAPIITEETTHRLEDIILQRIKDKAWDDVERKAKPTRDPVEFKKAIILDQEKSKISLAEVYEKEYIKQREALDPDNDKAEEEPKEHKEIRDMMQSLLSKLNALSNYHYTPKPAIPEIKIISNIPAINMEEVAPVATSYATLLAPEEVKIRPKGDIIGKSERTDVDKKRDRRKKKIKQKEREKQRKVRETETAKSQQSAGGFNKKINAKEKQRLLKSVTKARNIFVAKPEKDKSAKSYKL